MKEFENNNYWALILGGSSGLGLAAAKKDLKTAIIFMSGSNAVYASHYMLPALATCRKYFS